MRVVVLVSLAALAACTSDEGSWRTPNGEIAVSRVAAPAPANVGSPDAATMAVYATLANVSSGDDTLTGVSTAFAGAASIHSTMGQGASQMMHPTDHVVVPANGIAELRPGGTHIMLERLTRAFAPGDTLPLTLTFRRGGTVTVNASVFAYEQLQQALER